MASHQLKRWQQDQYEYHGKLGDPGDGGEIAVPDDVMEANCPMTTGDSNETRTVRAPHSQGQKLHLVLAVDGGGEAAVTFPAAVSGLNTIITFVGSGDFANFTSVIENGTLKWKIDATPTATGVAAS